MRSARLFGRLGVALAVLVFVSAAADAQSTRGPIVYGVKAGLNLSTLSTSGASIEFGNTSNRLTNLIAGVFVQIPLTDMFSVQPEVLYSGKGAKFDDPIEPGVVFRDRLHYLSIPVLARVSFGATTLHVRPYAYVGPQFGIKLSANESGGSATAPPAGDISSGVKRSDVGLAFGGGVDFQRYLLEVRYTLGLTNVDATNSIDTTKNRVFSLMAGIRF